MKPHLKPNEAGCNAEEHSAFPAPVEEHAIESPFLSAVSRFSFLFSVCFLSTFCLLTLAANLRLFASIIVSP